MIWLFLLLVACALGTRPSPCQQCLNFGIWNLGWCGNTSYDGICLMGWSVPPPTCTGLRWNFHYCPEEIQLEFSVYKAKDKDPANTSACGDTCLMDRYAKVMGPGFQNTWFFRSDGSGRYLISRGYLSLNASYCCHDMSNPTINFDFVLGSHIENADFPMTGCTADPFLTRNLSFNAVSYSWWSFFQMNQLNYFGINTRFQNCTMWINDMSLNVYAVDVDPYLDSVPILYGFEKGDGSADLPPIYVNGQNFLKFNYDCAWHVDGQEVFTTDSDFVNLTTQKCDVPDLFVQPTPDAPISLSLMLKPKETEDLKFTFDATTVLFYVSPSFVSVNPTTIPCGVTTTVSVIGEGFPTPNWENASATNNGSFRLIFSVPDFDLENLNVTFVNSTLLTFEIRHTDHIHESLSAPFQVVYVLGSNSVVLNFPFNLTIGAYIPPVPVPDSIPISPVRIPVLPPRADPEPEPEPEGFEAVILWVKDHPWIWIIIFLGGMLVLISIVGILAKVYKMMRTPNSLDDDGDGFAHSNQSLLIDRMDVQLKEQIGQGGFANIYRGYWHGTEVAVKVIKGTANTSNFIQEAKLMRRLRHPNIVAFLGLISEKPDLSIVTEYLQRGSLHDLLHKRSIVVEPEHIKQFAVDTCRGMTYLHANNIIHRDLKCHNLLVDKDWNVKVGDFGLSKAIEDVTGKNKMTVCGTPSWAAPEVMRHQDYTLKADVYSFGICLWEMCTRKLPYAGFAPYQVVISVATKGMRPELEKEIPPYFSDLIEVCWSEEPEKRPQFVSLISIIDNFEVPTPTKRRPYRTTTLDSQETELNDVLPSDF